MELEIGTYTKKPKFRSIYFFYLGLFTLNFDVNNRFYLLIFNFGLKILTIVVKKGHKCQNCMKINQQTISNFHKSVVLLNQIIELE